MAEIRGIEEGRTIQSVRLGGTKNVFADVASVPRTVRIVKVSRSDVDSARERLAALAVVSNELEAALHL